MRTLPTGAAAARWHIPIIATAIAGAWLLVVGVQLTGHANLLHHRTLIEGGPPLLAAVPLFLLGWQVMIVAMMLPASLSSIVALVAGVAPRARPGQALAGFLGSFALVWAAFGLLAFLGDLVLHHIVDASPWLAARPWLIEAGVVGFAGAYQFSPLKRLSLAACRHPAARAMSVGLSRRRSLKLGLDHGLACLGSSGALMLLMFVEGFANLWWMVALTAVMVYEATGRHGPLAARAVGAFLLAFGAVVLLTSALA